jgi:serine/threonine protein kinase
MFKVAQESLVGVKIKDYTFLKLIGEGNYGRVYEVFSEAKRETAAAKVMPKEIFKKTPKLMELVKTEIRVLRECKNDNVVRYVDNFMTERSIVIVMEYCEGGELQNYLHNKSRLTEHEATAFLKQILNGFKGLHEVEAMHRDFKAANVLLQNGVCKIADLGFAKQVKEESMTTTILGTGLTMAPEVHQERAYGRKADIWSVGVVFYQLIYGDYPFKGITDHDIMLSIKNTRPNYSKVNISDRARDFIERCLTVDPKARISWKEVYSHPLLLEEEKIIYGLTSSIRIQDNQVFYDRDSLPSKEEEKAKEEVKE